MSQPQALRLQELPVNFYGPLPAPHEDEARISCKKYEKTPKECLAVGEKTGCLGLVPGKCLDSNRMLTNKVDNNFNICEVLCRNIFCKILVNVEEASRLGTLHAINAS